MKALVIFDIDGTIVRGQSQRALLKYLLEKGELGRLAYARIMLWFVAYKLGLVHDPSAIMKYAFAFLKGRSAEEIGKMARDFFQSDLKSHIYPEALEAISAHMKQGDDVVLLSNSADILVKELAAFLGVKDYLSTRLEVKDGVYTGSLDGAPHYGKEKASIIDSYAAERGYRLADAWAYADHGSDAPLLENVGHPIAVNPTAELARIAEEKRWKIVRFA